MKKRIMIVMLAVMAIAFAGNSRGWEPVKAERSDIRLVVRDNDIEIKNAPGIIQVHTRTPVQIKIFTILGRLVSSDTPRRALCSLPSPPMAYISSRPATSPAR